jgi:hypothetical protein
MKKKNNKDYVVLDNAKSIAISIYTLSDFDFMQSKCYFKNNDIYFEPLNFSSKYIYVLKNIDAVNKLKIERKNKVTIAEINFDGSFDKITEIIFLSKKS